MTRKASGRTLTAIVVATGARLAAEDVKEWAPAIAAHFVQSAIQFVPIDRRDEAAKEWPSRVTATPGALSKIVVSLRFLLRAKRMMRASSLGEGRSQRRVGKPSTMTFSAFIVILAAGIFVILGAIIITAGPQLGHPGHTAWGSFQVAYLCMVSINVTLLALPTARTPILAAESARWESLNEVYRHREPDVLIGAGAFHCL